MPHTASNPAQHPTGPAASSRPADVGDTPQRTPQTPPTTVPLGPGGKPALVGRRVFRTPTQRRVVYAVIFEALAIVFTTLILAALGNSAGPSFVVGVVSSVVALVWNMVFNTLFEKWETWSGHTGRPLWVRILHMTLFEGGLVLFLVPAVALILKVSLWEAFLYELSLIIFFLIYTGIYAWCFDRVFGMPDSAQPGTRTATQDPA